MPADDASLEAATVRLQLVDEIGAREQSAAKLQPQPSECSSEPPPYEDVIVDQDAIERTQQKMWGSLLVWISNCCGIHAVRAPYFCSATECRKLRQPSAFLSPP